MRLILASASPRRKELLTQIAIPFEVRVSKVEEKVTTTNPAEVVLQLSAQKAKAVLKESEENVMVLGADTIVACEGQILGKPKDVSEAVCMLRMLSGRVHEVYTGVTIAYKEKEEIIHSFYEVTRVHFADMSEKEIQTYADTRDALDKAGAYGIQGFCARYITGIEGDYNNVVGLPVCRVYQELKRIGGVV